ncbi:MAG: glutamine synthetase family protein [Woeseia sp.]
MSDRKAFQAWLKKRQIEDVEALVPDMAGAARGKLLPADKCGAGELKLPEGVFAQTVSGGYIDNEANVEDRDMILVPDITTLRTVPWFEEPTASVFVDCLDKEGSPINTSPRQVLRKILALYETRGWAAVVAPEVEFYLINPHSDSNAEVEPPEGRLGRTEASRQPFSIDQMNDFDPFIIDVYSFCEEQGIQIEALSQEMGPAQFEINFLHGEPVTLADHVFLFKRTVREAAIRHEMHATFLAKPMAEQAGSALHIHQSIVDLDDGSNVFSTRTGRQSKLFSSYIAGLQKYMPEALLIFAPYVNSYRRFLNSFSSPINLAWAIDNRTVGLRVPDSGPEARRVENRLAGSDVNPYLAIAATLACGYLGMEEKLEPADPVEGSAYDIPFSLHPHIYASIDAMRNSKAMRKTLGDEFVSLYCSLKEEEYREFQSIITPWEREILLFNV